MAKLLFYNTKIRKISPTGIVELTRRRLLLSRALNVQFSQQTEMRLGVIPRNKKKFFKSYEIVFFFLKIELNDRTCLNMVLFCTKGKNSDFSVPQDQFDPHYLASSFQEMLAKGQTPEGAKELVCLEHLFSFGAMFSNI